MTHPNLLTTEPPDGTKLVFQDGAEWYIVVRDDRHARELGYGDRRHWFDGHGASQPRELSEWLRDAGAVYALGEKLAETS